MTSKKKIMISVASILIVVATGTGIYVGKEYNDKKSAVEVSAIELDKNSLELQVGSEAVIIAKIMPENTTEAKDITYSVSDESIAVIDETGKIKAIKEGKCQIVATSKADSKVTAIIELNVTALPITEIKAKDIKVPEEESKKIDAIVNDNATDKTLLYKSSNEKVATVDKDGNVKGVKEGSCEITITSKDGKVSKKIKATVSNKYGMKNIEDKIVYCTGGNLYTEPTTKSEKIQSVSENTEVTVVKENDGWYECSINGVKGYIGKSVVQDEMVVHYEEENNNNGDGSDYAYSEDNDNYSYDDGDSNDDYYYYEEDDNNNNTGGGYEESYDDGGEDDLVDVSGGYGYQREDGEPWDGTVSWDIR